MCDSTELHDYNLFPLSLKSLFMENNFHFFIKQSFAHLSVFILIFLLMFCAGSESQKKPIQRVP